MKNTTIKEISLHDEFVVRSPAFPIKKIVDLYNSKEPEKEIERYLLDNEFMEAIYLASPSLHELLETKGLRHKEGYDKKLVYTLVKYLARMSTRATPFGVFAGVGTAVFGKESKIERKGDDKILINIRLDYEVLSKLKDSLHALGLPKELLLYPNTTIYKQDKYIKYIQKKEEDGKLIFIEKSSCINKILKQILKYTKVGRSSNELIQKIVDNGYSSIESRNYITQLVKQDILVSELDCAVVEGEQSEKQVFKIAEKYKKSPEREKIIAVGEALFKSKSKEHLKYEKELVKRVKELYPLQKSKRILNTVLYYQYQGGLEQKIKYHALKGIHALRHFQNSKKRRIDGFKKKFEQIYGTEPVSLLHALNNSTGIGYTEISINSNVYYKDIKPKPKRALPVYTLDLGEIGLLRMLIQEWDGVSKLIITDSDLAAMGSLSNMAPSFYSIVEVFKEKGRSKLFINTAGGASANTGISRYNSDIGIGNLCLEMAKTDRGVKENRITAEVSYLSGPNIGNVSRHKKNVEYCIHYLNGNNCNEKDIAIKDLVLQIENDKLILRSKKLNKEIRPIISNAYNDALEYNPVFLFFYDYQFLECDQSAIFDWGSISAMYKHLPRVEYKDVVLSWEQWNLKPFDIEIEKWVKGNGELDEGHILKIREIFKLPKYIYIDVYDNRLLIDLESEVSVNVFLNEIKGLKYFRLSESTLGEDSVIKNEKGEDMNSEYMFLFKNG